MSGNFSNLRCSTETILIYFSCLGRKVFVSFFCKTFLVSESRIVYAYGWKLEVCGVGLRQQCLMQEIKSIIACSVCTRTDFLRVAFYFLRFSFWRLFETEKIEKPRGHPRWGVIVLHFPMGRHARRGGTILAQLREFGSSEVRYRWRRDAGGLDSSVGMAKDILKSCDLSVPDEASKKSIK